MPIPKRIIQTGKTQRLSLTERGVVANIQLLNADYEYLYFDDAQVEAFVDTHFPQHRAIFDGFPVRIQKYDFFRYLAIYHLGGFYFDLDVLLARSLDDLLGLGCVFPFEELTLHRYLWDHHKMDWEMGNYAFGARAGHPFIGAIIDNCVRAQREPEWAAAMWAAVPRPFRDNFFVLDTTGPGLVTRTLAESPTAADVHVMFPKDVREPSSWHQFGDHGVHLQAGGWRDRKGFWARRLGALWETRTRAGFAARSQALGPSRLIGAQGPAPAVAAQTAPSLR